MYLSGQQRITRRGPLFKRPWMQRGLGCASCGGKKLGRLRLGQDIYDPVTGTYGPSLPSADNPVAVQPYGPPVPTAADIAYDKAYMAANPMPNPAYAFQAPGSSSPGMITLPQQAQNTITVTAKPLTNYLPWLVLGVGGIALVATLKRR